MTFLVAELRPGATLCYLRIDSLADNGGADAPGCFYFFAGIVEAVAYAGSGAVFVGCDLGCGQGGGIVYVVCALVYAQPTSHIRATAMMGSRS